MTLFSNKLARLFPFTTLLAFRSNGERLHEAAFAELPASEGTALTTKGRNKG